jgi:uncharacterized phage-associated protein
MTVEFQFDFDRTLSAIVYLASKDLPELTKAKICKLLFFADKLHLVKYGRIITGDKYCAIPYGPIPSRTLDLLNAVIGQNPREEQAAKMSAALELDRRYEHPRFKAIQSFDATKLSQSDLMALDQVIATYGNMGFGELKAITHSTFPYKKAWIEKPEGASGADMNFEEFFEDDSDAIAGAREAMLEDDELRKTFPVR